MGKLRIISLLTAMMLVFAMTGCGNAGAEPIESPPMDPSSDPLVVSDASVYEQITYLVCTGDPASYIVYVITPDTVTMYDLTYHWVNSPGGYRYFEEGLPEEGAYHSADFALSPEEWERLTDSLTENRFEKLPEDLSVDGICDGASYEIEVKTADGTHRSGGYGAGDGAGKDQKRYDNVLVTLKEVLKEAKEEAKQTSGFTEPPASFLDATEDIFKNISMFDSLTLDELRSYLGPCFEVNNGSSVIMYGWELEEGGTGCVTVGAKGLIMDMEIRYDDHFVILKSKLDGISEDPDEIYVYKDIDDLTDEESRLFYLLSDLINNETQAISEDHLHSLDDYWIVSQYGEELDLDEPAILGQDSPFSQSRMPSAELAAFYSEVLGEERVFEPMSDSDYRPEIGIICADDGYCYSYNGCGWADYSNIVSVAEGSSVIIVDSEILNSMSVDESPTAYVRLVLTPTDSAYGYELTDYRYYSAS